MSRSAGWLLLFALVAGEWASPATGATEQVRSGLSAPDLFALAERAVAENQPSDAITIYSALTRDPDLEVRSEARFRNGLLLGALKRFAEAAVTFRALLDEKPNTPRVQLELARVLAAMGDEAGARRAVRQAQATGLPPDVAAVVDQFAAALQSTRRFGGSLQVALAPDSNVNRATDARTLDTVIAPLTLARNARERSGVGLKLSGQGYVRFNLSDRLALLPRVSAAASLYHESAFNDVFGSALIGLEWRIGRDRLTPAIGPTWRWYGGSLYARTDTVALDWLHPIGRRTQLTLSGSAAHAGYRLNRLQSGGLFDLSLSVEHALAGRAGLGGSLGATRQTARDPGYATTAAYGTLLGWRDIGRTTIFANTSLRRTEGDARLFLFPERRREWLLQVVGGATFRGLTYRGFAPVVRLTYERNSSTIGLYDYQRRALDFGIARAF